MDPGRIFTAADARHGSATPVRAQALPFIRRARSVGIPETVADVLKVTETAAQRHERRLVLVTGVPGAGKTLVGLQVVHAAGIERYVVQTPARKHGAPATFLSGNGPLVQVLQDAIGSRVFVQDMHRYIREYGLKHADRVPPEHLIAFDEAQRAWDAAKVRDFYEKKLPAGNHPDLDRSEPELLVDIAGRIPDWACLLALVGGGQIHTGEGGADSMGRRLADLATSVGRARTARARAPLWWVGLSG